MGSYCWLSLGSGTPCLTMRGSTRRFCSLRKVARRNWRLPPGDSGPIKRERTATSNSSSWALHRVVEWRFRRTSRPTTNPGRKAQMCLRPRPACQNMKLGRLIRIPNVESPYPLDSMRRDTAWQRVAILQPPHNPACGSVTRSLRGRFPLRPFKAASLRVSSALSRRFADFSLMWRTGTFRSMRPKRHRLSLCDRVLQQRRKQRHGCDEPTEGLVLQQTSATCQALCLRPSRRRCKTYPLRNGCTEAAAPNQKTFIHGWQTSQIASPFPFLIGERN